jgi:hypothetical protein
VRALGAGVGIGIGIGIGERTAGDTTSGAEIVRMPTRWSAARMMPSWTFDVEDCRVAPPGDHGERTAVVQHGSRR